jgi:hypothetical protein
MDAAQARQKALERKAETLHHPNLNMSGSGEESVAGDLIRPSKHQILQGTFIMRPFR